MKYPILLSALLLGLSASAPILAADAPIARIPTVSENTTDPDNQAAFAETRARGGQVINLQLLIGNAPKLARANQQVAYSIRFDSVTPRRLRELAITRTVEIIGGAYELHQHRPMMLACGFTQAQLDGLAGWRGTPLFTDQERAELAYVEQLIPKGDVDDATFNAFAKYFTPQEIVELTMTVGSYVGTGMLTNALRLKIEDDGRQSPIGKC